MRSAGANPESEAELAPAAARARPRSGPAEVRTVLGARHVQVAFDGDASALEADLAVPGYDDPREGDRVLALTDDTGATWIVGVIRRAPLTLLDEALESPMPVQVRDRRGRLLFEYDPGEDRAVLHVPSGDLEVSVPEGALRMRARDGVEVASQGEVRVDAGSVALRAEGKLAGQGAEVALEGRRVELEASRGERARSRVTLEAGELSLVGSVLTAAADRAEVLASRIGVKAHQLESHVDRVRTVAKVLDVRAGRILERAKDVYRDVSGLSQTRAGRLRLVAEKAAQLVGENTLLKARDRMKVKGEQIHLA
jgi:hypothetical protein